MNCKAEILYENMRIYLNKLSDGKTLDKVDDQALRSLLDQYWNVDCPEGATCRPNTCRLAKPEDWIAHHGYTCAGEMLLYFEYEEVTVLKIKERKSIDALDAHWARRPGNFAP
jgi:hypothetical protein